MVQKGTRMNSVSEQKFQWESSIIPTSFVMCYKHRHWNHWFGNTLKTPATDCCMEWNAKTPCERGLYFLLVLLILMWGSFDLPVHDLPSSLTVTWLIQSQLVLPTPLSLAAEFHIAKGLNTHELELANISCKPQDACVLTKHLVAPGQEPWYLQNCPSISRHRSNRKQNVYLKQERCKSRKIVFLVAVFQNQEHQAQFYFLLRYY